MLSYGRFIGRNLDAVHFVVRDIGLNLLNLRAHTLEYVAGRLPDCGKLLPVELSGARYVALYNERKHKVLEFTMLAPYQWEATDCLKSPVLGANEGG